MPTGKWLDVETPEKAAGARELLGTDTYVAYATARNGSANDRAALAAADAAAVAAKKPLLLLEGTHLVTSDLTIASAVMGRLGGLLKPANGVTITITGGVSAFPWQRLFDLSAGGNVVVYMPRVRAEWWGAKIDAVTDDTVAVHGALYSCQHSPAAMNLGLSWTGMGKGGGTVELPPGTVLIAGLILNTGCYLDGAGMLVTTLKLKDGANTHAIRGFTSPGGSNPNGRFYGARNLTIDANGANQTGSVHGVYLQTVPNTGEPNPDDNHSQWENILIWGAKDTGFFAYGAKGIVRCTNILSYNSGVNNFQTGKDSTYFACESAASGTGPGWLIRAGSTQLVSVKSWRSGWPFDGRSVSDPEGKTAQPGFSVDVDRGLVTLAAANAQNNMGDGFYLTGEGTVHLTGVADSNNMMPGADPTAHPGVKVNHLSNSRIDVSCYAAGYQGGLLLGNQYFALQITDGTSKNNIITVTQNTDPQDANSLAKMGPAVDPTPTIHGSNIILRNDAKGPVMQTSSAKRVYGTDASSNQTTITYDGAATAFALAQRDANGQVVVPSTPTGSTHATSKSYVDTAITNLVGGAPGALDTLKELADAINDDASYAATITTALGLKISRTLSAKRLYGTDGSGNQTTVTYDTAATAFTVPQRDVNGLFRIAAFATGSRPTAAAAGASAMIYDSTLSKPIYSDGTTWRDAAGTAV